MRLTYSLLGFLFLSIIFQFTIISDFMIRQLILENESSSAIAPHDDSWSSSFGKTQDGSRKSPPEEKNIILSTLNTTLVKKTLPLLNNNFAWKDDASASNLSMEKSIEQPKPLSIIIDWENDGEETWISRLAFAKMLQIEAKNTYGIETDLIILVEKRPKARIWYTCFSRLKESFQLIVGIKQWDARKIEQINWLGEKAKLLEATQNTWRDGLKLLSKLSRSESASFSQSFSLPFLHIKTPPSSLRDWKHVDELVEILRVEPSCCEVSSIGRPENMELHSTVFIKDSESSNVLPSQLAKLIRRPKLTKVLLVTNQPDSLSEHAAALQSEHGYVIQFFHLGSVGGHSITSRLCLLTQNSGHELLIASNGNSLGLWAAMSNNASQEVRIIETSKNYDEPMINYEANDPRSRIKVETIAPAAPDIEVGSIGNPLSLVIHISEKPVEQIAQGYVLQLYLEEKFNIYSHVLLLKPRNQKKISEIDLMLSCFPELSNLRIISEDNDEYDIRRNQMQSFGILDAFELRDKNSVDFIPEMLHNAISSLPRRIQRVPPRVMPLLTFPFVSVDQNFTMRALKDSRKKLDGIFATNSLPKCRKLQPPATLQTDVAY